MRTTPVCPAICLVVALWGGSSTEARADEPAQTRVEGARLFREKIEPVLVAECYKCHSASAAKLRGGLRLDSRERLLAGGDSGPVVVPGKSDESPLIQAIRHEDGLAMPPKAPRLAERVIADFVAWVDMGAIDPRDDARAPATGPSADAAKTHWAFQPVRTPAPPTVGRNGWVQTPIDAFILAKLDEKHWSPAAPAPRGAGLRRASFDLTGLPPTPEEVAAFENDPSPELEAEARVIDRLLESPRYGERWAQHWLDVVRFAESEGYEYDRAIPGAWRYRDYVIASLNRDKPFDVFLTEQLAGDEIAPGDPICQTASVFHRLGPVRRNAGNPDIALSRNEVLTERTDIIGTAFLGLTVGCARCHNHKLEPISQKDYYRLEAFLAATDEHNVVLASDAEKQAWEAKTKVVKEAMDTLQKKARGAVGAEKEQLTAQLEELEDELPDPLPTIPGTWNDFAHRTDVHVLKRGVWENKGEAVGPRPLGVLVAENLEELPADVKDPRTRLARWLTAPAHPLTSRVIANRIWQHHFGAGLVKTVNDFGTKGDRPIHRELLDWLAASIVEHDWRQKPIHRLIMLSATYRQSAQSPIAAEASRVDPENRLFWRFNRRRLDAEEIRDAMLAVSGRLNPKAGGPGVMVPVDAEMVRLLYKPSQWKAANDPSEYDRRSIYLAAKRNLRLPFLETFDAPALLTGCPRRESSTHAPQALEMLNGNLSNDLANSWAARLEREACGKPDRIIQRAFLLALGREPNAEEQSLSAAFLRDGSVQEFALAVFNLNGFLYVP
jgi:hypothetical protein